jgi:broad specificity phosphatase PhoE
MPSRLICSDLLRARGTVTAISHRCNLPVKIDERLREENLGEWAGLSRQEVKVTFPEEYDRWCKGDIFESRGEREGPKAVARRAFLAVSETVSNSYGQSIVVVTHLNTAIAIIARMLEIPQDK